MENRRREVVFWLGLGYVVYSDLFLLPSLRTRHNTRNQLLALEHEQDSEGHNNGAYIDEQHEPHVERQLVTIEFESTLLYKIFAAIRFAVMSLFVTFLMSNEISFLYCEGHTGTFEQIILFLVTDLSN